eukprot:PhM_4_TR18456/c0_g1_i2/m.17631
MGQSCCCSNSSTVVVVASTSTYHGADDATSEGTASMQPKGLKGAPRHGSFFAIGPAGDDPVVLPQCTEVDTEEEDDDESQNHNHDDTSQVVFDGSSDAQQQDISHDDNDDCASSHSASSRGTMKRRIGRAPAPRPAKRESTFDIMMMGANNALSRTYSGFRSGCDEDATEVSTDQEEDDDDDDDGDDMSVAFSACDVSDPFATPSQHPLKPNISRHSMRRSPSPSGEGRRVSIQPAPMANFGSFKFMGHMGCEVTDTQSDDERRGSHVSRVSSQHSEVIRVSAAMAASIAKRVSLSAASRTASAALLQRLHDGSFTDTESVCSRLDDGGHRTLLVTELIRGYDDDGNKLLNEYAVLGDLGSGSYGKVKLALDTTTELTVAIKILKKARLQKAGTNARDEMEVMERLRHPNIVRLHAVIDDPSALKMYMVMEYVPAGTLNDIVKDQHRILDGVAYNQQPMFESSKFRTRFLDVLHGLQYLHNHNVIHMDIKP